MCVISVSLVVVALGAHEGISVSGLFGKDIFSSILLGWEVWRG